MEIIRDIVDMYILSCNKGLVAFCPEKELSNYESMASKKNFTLSKRKITTNVDRANQIGYNLFNVNYPCKNKNELIAFRNSVIKDWMDRCSSIKNCDKKVVWERIAKKHNIQSKTVDEFSQSIFDKIEYSE
jgi:hypothetical protein